MNIYTVSVNYRPNVNRTGRVDRELTVQAYSKEQALFLAGLTLGLERASVFRPSLQLTVTRTGRLR